MQLHSLERLGLALWGLAVTLIAIKTVLEPGQHTVVDSYLLGAERWQARQPLYDGPQGFLYTPTFALLFSFLLDVPVYLTDLLWRLFIIGLYFLAISQMTQVLQTNHSKPLLGWLGLISLVAVPIAFSGLRNGQLNVVLISVMVLTCCQILKKQWNTAAVLLALTISLKPTFIVFFLLATTLFRPLWSRVPPLLLIFIALPLVSGGWKYGIEQYGGFIYMARSAAELGMVTPKWASLFNVPAQLWGITVAGDIQNLIKIALAGATWLTCLYALRRFDLKTGLFYLLNLAACYHMLFNPRSVNTDYIILGTVLAFWLATALHTWNDRRLAITTGLLALGVLFAFDLSRLIAPGTTSWFNPLMALVFSFVVILGLTQGKRLGIPAKG